MDHPPTPRRKVHATYGKKPRRSYVNFAELDARPGTAVAPAATKSASTSFQNDNVANQSDHITPQTSPIKPSVIEVPSSQPENDQKASRTTAKKGGKTNINVQDNLIEVPSSQPALVQPNSTESVVIPPSVDSESNPIRTRVEDSFVEYLREKENTLYISDSQEPEQAKDLEHKYSKQHEISDRDVGKDDTATMKSPPRKKSKLNLNKDKDKLPSSHRVLDEDDEEDTIRVRPAEAVEMELEAVGTRRSSRKQQGVPEAKSYDRATRRHSTTLNQNQPEIVAPAQKKKSNPIDKPADKQAKNSRPSLSKKQNDSTGINLLGQPAASHLSNEPDSARRSSRISKKRPNP